MAKHLIDTDAIRAAMPGYAEAAACGDMQTNLEDVVIALCNEIDRLRKEIPTQKEAKE